MFIEYGICKYPKAPEGRHVTFAQITDEADSYIKPLPRLEHSTDGKAICLSLQRSDMSAAEKMYHSRTPEECNGYGETFRPF